MPDEATRNAASRWLGGGYPHGPNKTSQPVRFKWLRVVKSWSK